MVIESLGSNIANETLKMIWDFVYRERIKSVELEIRYHLENQRTDTKYFKKRFEEKIEQLKSQDIPNFDENYKKLSKEIKELDDKRPENAIIKPRIINLIHKELTKDVNVEQLEDVSKPGITGLSPVRKITIKNLSGTYETYYIKPFCVRDEGGKISPKEPFLYKVLEYMKLGPVTRFLVDSNTSRIGSQLAVDNNFIMTLEVKNLIFDDKISNKEDYEKFKNKEENLVKFSLVDVVKGILSIDDIYPHNRGNYGITKINENGDYNFILIDHLPGGNGPIRGLLEDEELRSYSPRLSAQDLCKRQKYSYKGNLSDIRSSTEIKFTDKILSEKVNHILFTTEGDRMSISDAIKKAKKDIENLIKDNQDCFTKDATETLADHINFINDTMEKRYKKTDYFKKYENTL